MLPLYFDTLLCYALRKRSKSLKTFMTSAISHFNFSCFYSSYGDILNRVISTLAMNQNRSKTHDISNNSSNCQSELKPPPSFYWVKLWAYFIKESLYDVKVKDKIKIPASKTSPQKPSHYHSILMFVCLFIQFIQYQLPFHFKNLPGAERTNHIIQIFHKKRKLELGLIGHQMS